MPPNPLLGIAAAALQIIGYVREWGDPESIQLFVNYDEFVVVSLHDSEALTAEDIVDSLQMQGVDMAKFFAAIDDLAED